MYLIFFDCCMWWSSCVLQSCWCVPFIWGERLQSSKSTRPRGWGWRQTVMLSLGRKVAEKIRTHTENIFIEPLSSCAGFVRMTQLSCEEEWWGKLKRPAHRLSSPLLFLSNWCGLAAPSDRLCSTSESFYTGAGCCRNLQRGHWGELAHYIQADQNHMGVKGSREKVIYSTAKMKGRDLLKSIFQSECVYWTLSLWIIPSILAIALLPGCNSILKGKEKHIFDCKFLRGDQRGASRETDCIDRKERRECIVT